MIHLAAFMDIETGLGRTIYDDNSIQISEELIWPMISALNNFVSECTGSERSLVNAALEDIKIYLYSPLGENNPLRFVFFTDLYDNNSYLETKGQAIFEVLSPFISFELYNPPTDVSFRVQDITKYTQNFPTDSIKQEFLEKILRKIKYMEDEEKLFIADLFIGDIDQGKVLSLVNKNELREKNSLTLFSELLTAFSIDSNIFVRSSLTEKEKTRLVSSQIDTLGINEGWYLKQLAGRESDFWLVGYFYYKPTAEEQIHLMLDEIGDELSEILHLEVGKRPF
ncbi:MAG: hypothetical protein GOP50_00120 [Candidatus Heimdallarchaeota archaeon]|nr:hypothetical protein [Candidatus Heimdallarchaeota archaeon]